MRKFVLVAMLVVVFAGAAAVHAGSAGSSGLAPASLPTGTVWTWGRNYSGQLGDGTTTDSVVPVQASNLTEVVAVAAGASHSIGLKSDGPFVDENARPDLVVASLTTPPVVVAGRPISVTWTVKNQGPGNSSPSWGDRLVLVSDTSYDDFFLANVAHTSAVTAGNSYTVTTNVTLPKVAPGSYHLILRVDPANALRESNETNNQRMVTLTITAPDLTPTALTAPLAGKPWQTVPITWTVTNQGNGDALPTWQDRVYLSTDTTWDSGDTFLTMITRTTTLAAGDSYTLSANVPLTGTPGTYYLILRTDMWGQVKESDETNDTVVVPIVLQP